MVMKEEKRGSTGLLAGVIRAVRDRVRSPLFVLTAIFIVVLGYLIVVPLLELILRSITWTSRDVRMFRVPGAEIGALTLHFWREILGGLNAEIWFYAPLRNSLFTGGVAATLAIIVGSVLAWLVTRTDLPGRHWFKPVLTLPYIVPSFAIALAWDTLFKSPKYGGAPGLLEAAFGIQPADWVSHGPFPIIVTLAIHYSPFAFLLASGALASLNAEMEESADILGASRFTILKRITLPIVAPALAAAFVLAFAKAVGTFAMPYLLGVPVQYHTLATRLYASLSLGLESLAYVMSLVLIIITALVLFFSTKVLGKNIKRFQTIGGKGFRNRTVALGKWRWLIFAGVLCFALLTAIFPLCLLGYQTLMGVDGRFDFANLTLHYWVGQSNPVYAGGEPGVLNNPRIIGATWNTVQLAVIASVITAIVGLIIGYITIRNRGSWSARLLEQVSFLPFLFPGMALAAMYLSLFAVQRGPIPALYGTFTLLILICIVDRLPYGVRMGASAVTQIGSELEEAAEIQGASWFTRFRRIILPLAVPGMVSTVMICFVGLMRELSLFILLITPSTNVLMTLGLQYTEQNLTQLSNAIVLIVAAITIIGEIVVWRIGKTRLMRAGQKNNAH